MRITFQPENFAEIAESSREIDTHWHRAVRPVLGRLGKNMSMLYRQEVPHYKGKLERSVRYDVRIAGQNATVEVGPTADYAEAVLRGSRPHMPPVKAITPWAQAHGISPWALAISISRHGTKGNDYTERVAQKSGRDRERAAQELAALIVREWGR